MKYDRRMLFVLTGCFFSESIFEEGIGFHPEASPYKHLITPYHTTHQLLNLLKLHLSIYGHFQLLPVRDLEAGRMHINNEIPFFVLTLNNPINISLILI